MKLNVFIEKIKAKHIELEHKHWSWSPFYNGALEAFSILYENNGWISVNDRLPEGTINCLIYYCEDWNFDRQWKIDWCFYNSQGEWCTNNSKVNPTHWQPLPEPPQ